MKEDDDDTHDEDLKNTFGFAVVVRADEKEIQALKQFLADHNLAVYYQKISSTRLLIKEDHQKWLPII